MAEALAIITFIEIYDPREVSDSGDITNAIEHFSTLPENDDF